MFNVAARLHRKWKNALLAHGQHAVAAGPAAFHQLHCMVINTNWMCLMHNCVGDTHSLHIRCMPCNYCECNLIFRFNDARMGLIHLYIITRVFGEYFRDMRNGNENRNNTSVRLYILYISAYNVWMEIACVHWALCEQVELNLICRSGFSNYFSHFWECSFSVGVRYWDDWPSRLVLVQHIESAWMSVIGYWWIWTILRINQNWNLLH